MKCILQRTQKVKNIVQKCTIGGRPKTLSGVFIRKGFFMETLTQNVLDNLISYLKKDKFKNILQELKLEHCTDENGDYIYLVCIKIKKSQQCKGYGSVVMSEIVRLADDNNVRIVLYATNVFGSELKRLYGFYRKLGFVLIKKNNDGRMVYFPQKKKKKL